MEPNKSRKKEKQQPESDNDDVSSDLEPITEEELMLISKRKRRPSSSFADPVWRKKEFPRLAFAGSSTHQSTSSSTLQVPTPVSSPIHAAAVTPAAIVHLAPVTGLNHRPAMTSTPSTSTQSSIARVARTSFSITEPSLLTHEEAYQQARRLALRVIDLQMELAEAEEMLSRSIKKAGKGKERI